jgi:hypothetical protein
MNKPIIELLTTDEYWIAHGNATRMEATGGGFSSNLGKLFFKADTGNAARLVRAFPHEFLLVSDTNVNPNLQESDL